MKRAKSKRLKSREVFRSVEKRNMFLVVIAFACFGLATLYIANAAPGTGSFEAESSTKTGGSSSVVEASTSGGSALKFKDAATPSSSFVIATAGDVGKSSDRTRQQRTADLVKRIKPTYLLALGDLAYEDGSDANFAANYHPYWGVPEIYNITKPVPGNHEYNTSGAAGYFKYFDPQSTGKFGPIGKGYYSFTKDNWLFLMINSECSSTTRSDGCTNSSVQGKWVDQQLAAHPNKCVVASWHKPRVSNGQHSDNTGINDIWNKIVARKGVVLTGHNHFYTRTVPLGMNAQKDSANGITQFLVGTGGASFYSVSYPDDEREVLKFADLGVLKMTLSGNKIDYQFLNTSDVVRDQGSLTLGCSGSV